MNQQEYNELVTHLKELVADGNVEAMCDLGDLYYQGISDTDENTFAALPYWKMAADHGDNDVAFRVAKCFMLGNGCEQDYVQGYKYLKQSADNGFVEAQHIGWLVSQGWDRHGREPYSCRGVPMRRCM